MKSILELLRIPQEGTLWNHIYDGNRLYHVERIEGDVIYVSGYSHYHIDDFRKYYRPFKPSSES